MNRRVLRPALLRTVNYYFTERRGRIRLRPHSDYCGMYRKTRVIKQNQIRCTDLVFCVDSESAISLHTDVRDLGITEYHLLKRPVECHHASIAGLDINVCTLPSGLGRATLKKGSVRRALCEGLSLDVINATTTAGADKTVPTRIVLVLLSKSAGALL